MYRFDKSVGRDIYFWRNFRAAIKIDKTWLSWKLQFAKEEKAQLQVISTKGSQQ